MSLDQTGEKSELYRYVYAQRVEMFSNIFVFTIAEVWSQGLRDSFCFDWRMFVCEQKPNFAFCKNSYRLFACLFSLSIKIFFFVAGLSKAKMSWIVILTFGHGEIHGNFAWSTFHHNSGLFVLHLNVFPCKNRFFRE